MLSAEATNLGENVVIGFLLKILFNLEDFAGTVLVVTFPCLEVPTVVWVSEMYG